MQQDMAQNYFGTGSLERTISGTTVIIHGKNATIAAKGPAEKSADNPCKQTIYANPAELLRAKNVLPSLSLVRFGKVKPVIDGVIAALEEHIASDMSSCSRQAFLRDLGHEENISTQAKVFLEKLHDIGDSSIQPSQTVQGFYDWTPALQCAFHQIKALANFPSALDVYLAEMESEQSDQKILDNIKNVIGQAPALAGRYRHLRSLYEKITAAPVSSNALFPAAKLPDQEFFENLPFPEASDSNTNLGQKLIAAIRNKQVSFDIDSDAGLYLRQMHELLPLILRDTPEFEKFLVDENYEKILDDEFISQWVATRDTHVAHTRYDGMIMASLPQGMPPISISPELHIEPFATSYQRMAQSIDFLQRTLQVYVPELLEQGRILHNGKRAQRGIGEELTDLSTILQGMSLLSHETIHLPFDVKSDDEQKMSTAKEWLNSIATEPDFDRNTAIFVPIIRTVNGQRQISYVNAGFKLVDIGVEYAARPSVTMNDAYRGYEFTRSQYRLPVLVHKELQVPSNKLPNSARFRELLGKDVFTQAELDEVVAKLESS